MAPGGGKAVVLGYCHMLAQLRGLAGFPETRPAIVRKIDFVTLLSVCSVALLIDTELVATVAAGVWSICGLLNLPPLAVWVLGTLVALPTIWICILVAVLAFDTETDSANL
jgi:hypothetical protein